MSDASVTQIMPHDKVLHVLILKRTLDEASARALMDEVLTAAGSTPRLPVVLDMRNVRFAPSIALGTLVRLASSFRLDGRRIALVSTDPRIYGTIRVTQLHQLLDIEPTLEDYVARLGKR